MPQANEIQIRKIFDEMVKYKPSLARYLAVDEEDGIEDIDFRILGEQIIKYFPWPIGVELRRLFSGFMRQPDRSRLDQIFKTIERIVQFISFVMISQMWMDKKRNLITIPQIVSREFENRFTQLTMGNYTWLIRSFGKLFEKNNLVWFIPEMGEKFNNKFYDSLDFWVPERNEIGHYQINLTPEETQKRCVEYDEKLTKLLVNIAFLVKYKLVSVRDIKVKKTKIQEARFYHTIDLLNSSDSDFMAKEIDEEKFTESNAVLLTKNIQSMDEYLNLSPLIIDTHSEILDTKEKFGIKKDIFLYTKFRNDHLLYLGTEITEKCDLRSLSNYEELVAEYKDLMSHISPVSEIVES